MIKGDSTKAPFNAEAAKDAEVKQERTQAPSLTPLEKMQIEREAKIGYASRMAASFRIR